MMMKELGMMVVVATTGLTAIAPVPVGMLLALILGLDDAHVRLP